MNLTVDDSGDGLWHSATLDSAGVLGSDYGIITGLAPALIGYEYYHTGSVTIETGIAVGSIVNVKATGKPATMFGQISYGPAVTLIGHASATVNVGNAGSVKQIIGLLTITDPPAGAHVTVNVDDSTDNDPHLAVNLD